MRIASQTSSQQMVGEQTTVVVAESGEPTMNVKTGLKGGDDEGIVWGS
jgi:hypothetical protein